MEANIIAVGKVELCVHQLGELDRVALGVDFGLSAKLCGVEAASVVVLVVAAVT